MFEKESPCINRSLSLMPPFKVSGRVKKPLPPFVIVLPDKILSTAVPAFKTSRLCVSLERERDIKRGVAGRGWGREKEREGDRGEKDS